MQSFLSARKSRHALHRLARLLDGVDGRAEHHLRADRMQRELETGDDTEIAAAAFQRPQQVGIFIGRGMHQPAVGRDHVGGHEIVDRQAIAAPEPAHAARQRQAGDTGIGDDAARGSESEGLGLAIDVTPGGAALDPGPLALCVHPHRAHARKIYHHAAVADGVPGDIVAAAADGNRQFVCPGEIDCGHDVGCALGPDDHGRAAVDHGVPDGASVVVTFITRNQDGAANAFTQMRDGDGELAGACGVRCVHGRSPCCGQPALIARASCGGRCSKVYPWVTIGQRDVLHTNGANVTL